MDIKVVFGQVLKELRTKKGISQEKLALEADIDRSYISKLENGAYQPSLAMVFAISKVLEIQAKDIVSLVEETLATSED